MKADGSVDVAAQFVALAPSAEHQLGEAVSAYVRRKQVQESVDLLADLAAPPTVEAVADDRLRVRFHSRPKSERWKDWLVEFTNEVAHTVDSVEVEGFFDYASGVLRWAHSD